MSKKYMEDVMNEVLKNPYVKIAALDPDYNLILRGHRCMEALSYFLVSPAYSVAKVGDALWQPEGQSFPAPDLIAYLNPDEFLAFEWEPEPAGYLWSSSEEPGEALTFVLFARFSGYAEAYIATPTIDAPLHFLWDEEQADSLSGLCLDLITANVPELADDLRRFLMSQDDRPCADEDDDDD